MRARNVKPGFFTSDQLSECSDAARILFIGLWCMADRDGLLEDRPKKIKAEVFPMEERDIDGLLGQLSKASLIIRYETNGARCIAIPNFRKHQRPHPKEVTSGLPKPTPTQSRKGVVEPCLGAAEVNLKTASCAECGMMNDECGMMNVESSSPDSSQPKNDQLQTNPKTPDAPDLARDAKAWKAFWAAYPNKDGGELVAKAIWNAMFPTPEIVAEIMAGLERWKLTKKWRDGFVKECQNWLRDELWKDHPKPQAAEHPPPAQSTFHDRVKKALELEAAKRR